MLYQNSLLILGRKGIGAKDTNLESIGGRGLRDGDGEGGGRRRRETEGTMEGSGDRVPAIGSHHEEAMAAHRFL